VISPAPPAFLMMVDTPTKKAPFVQTNYEGVITLSGRQAAPRLNLALPPVRTAGAPPLVGNWLGNALFVGSFIRCVTSFVAAWERRRKPERELSVIKADTAEHAIVRLASSRPLAEQPASTKAWPVDTRTAASGSPSSSARRTPGTRPAGVSLSRRVGQWRAILRF